MPCVVISSTASCFTSRIARLICRSARSFPAERADLKRNMAEQVSVELSFIDWNPLEGTKQSLCSSVHTPLHEDPDLSSQIHLCVHQRRVCVEGFVCTC